MVNGKIQVRCDKLHSRKDTGSVNIFQGRLRSAIKTVYTSSAWRETVSMLECVRPVADVTNVSICLSLFILALQFKFIEISRNHLDTHLDSRDSRMQIN